MDEKISKKPLGLHAGSQSDIPDLDKMIEENSCGQIYLQLEKCLVDTDRNWKKCQKEVEDLSSPKIL